MKMCCEVFESNVKKDKTLVRGISFYKDKDNDNVVMQFSCIDGKKKTDFFELLKLGVGKYKFNVSISGDVVIQYCPWCGTKLV